MTLKRREYTRSQLTDLNQARWAQQGQLRRTQALVEATILAFPRISTNPLTLLTKEIEKEVAKIQEEYEIAKVGLPTYKDRPRKRGKS